MPSSGLSLSSKCQILCNISILNWVVGTWWDSRWWWCCIVENLIIEPCRNGLLIIHHYIKYFDRHSNYGPKSKFKIEAMHPPSWIFRNLSFDQWLHSCFSICVPNLVQNVDRCPNYGRKSKFKMAAVRHLGILILPYRTTHEVFSLGYISLSNYVLIRYVGLIFLQNWLEVEMPIYAPKISVFLGSGP